MSRLLLLLALFFPAALAAAERIITLAPHLSELTYAAGAGGKLVGVVSYSDYPAEAAALPVVGGYNRPDIEAILALRPDLVLAWHSGNPPALLERLQALGIRVEVSEPRELADIPKLLRRIGTLAGTIDAAEAAADAFEQRLKRLRARYAEAAPVSVFYQIWHQPLMSINGKHLISRVISLCGGRNPFAALPTLAPQLDREAVLAADPEAIVAGGMGDERPEWLDEWRAYSKMRAVNNDHLFFIHPDLLQRHGPRILDGAELLCAQLQQVREARP